MEKSLAKRLSFLNFKLDTLLEVTQSINENLSTDELLEKFAAILTEKLNIGKLAVYAYNKSWEKVLESGLTNGKSIEIDVENELLAITEITTATAADLTHHTEIDTIIPVFHNNHPVAFVLIGDIEEERDGVSPTIKHLLFIQTLTNIIIVAIENRRLVQESLKQEAIKKELELASRMQSMLIPDAAVFPRNEKVFIDAFYLPHLEIGGDYYDCMELNSNEVGFCIADVSGKGISAAILMSNFQANLRALFSTSITLPDLVQKLNSRVLMSANGEKFITLFVAKYHYSTRMITYINAGHNPPFLYDTVNKSVNLLDTGCPGMGMLDELPKVKVGQIYVPNKSKLICYTDGLVELKTESTQDTGMKAVEDCISNDMPIDMTIQHIIKSMNVNKDNVLFFDDISILGIDLF